MARELPYGAWPSSISAELLVAGAVGLSEVWVEGDTAYWAEGRPEEGGRVQLVRRDPDGTLAELLPAGFSARTAVHEYGGASWWVREGVVFFANWDDQRLYRLDPGGLPSPLSPAPQTERGFRFSDGRLSQDGRWVFAVREWHPVSGGEARNEIVVLSAHGSPRVKVLATGRDFVAAPRVSPDGRMLAWLTWDHPNMPWDGTELWVGRLVADADSFTVAEAHRVAGGPSESLAQPEWGRHGQLFVTSDRSDWWNVFRVDGIDELHPLAPTDAEVSLPAWVFGQSRYGFGADGLLVCTYSKGGKAYVLSVTEQGSRADVETNFTGLTSLRVHGEHLTAVATSVDREGQIVRISVQDGTAEILRPARNLGLAEDLVAKAEPVAFPSPTGESHGYFYPPTNPDVVGPPGERPPLLVLSHGGPTAAANPSFNLSIQYWTSRGFGVLDVDYGGSTGYGRAYRQRLNGQWGIVDVDDCCAAALHVVNSGRADVNRLAIRGGSAGGFTTLAALAFRDVVRAGASYYGVADLGALARDTHKFESRYLDGLVGPWPAAEAIYEARSPLYHADLLDCPVIVFQGLEDKVVPPAQSKELVAALAAKGIPHAYLAFPGEQHGFRRAENIVRAQTAELYFYGRVFGFEPADKIEPVPVAFEERLVR